MTTRIATATITRWIDGDTVVVDALDPGWGVSLQPTTSSDMRCHIRLAGVNTPDTNKNAKWYDPVLAARASAYSAAVWPSGTKVTLTSYGFDDFGRTLATITDPDGNDVGSLLVTAGYARTGDYPAPPEES